MAVEDEIPPFDPMLLTTDERAMLFSNVFRGTIIPDSSAVFFDNGTGSGRQEIKSADVSVRGSDQPWQVVYGAVRVGGLLSFVTTDLPGGGEWMHMVHTIAGHKIDALTGLYIDGQAVPFDLSGSSIHGWSTGSWSLGATGYVFTSLSDGDDNQPANADLVAQSAALFPGIWTSYERQRRLAHVYNIFYFSKEKFPTGSKPEVQFLIRGKTGIWDPRSSTYIYTNNACLCIADYLNNTRFGLNAVYGDDIDETNLEEAADIADENVGLVGGGTEKRYTMNGVFDTSEEPQQVLEKMRSAIAGPIVNQNGKWRMYPGKWREPTLHFVAADIVGAVKFTTLNPRSERFNGVKGTFMNPATWEIEDFPPVLNSFYQTQDGEQKLADRAYPFCTSSATAQRLSKIDLEDERQPITFDAPFTLKAFQTQIGDNVYLTLDRYGWTNKPFRVKDFKFLRKGLTLSPLLTLKETAAGVYDWNNGSETVGDIAPNTNLPDPSYVRDPISIDLQSGTETLYTREDGTVFSRIKVIWGAVIDPFVRNGGTVEVRMKNNATGEAYRIADTVPGDQTFTFILDVKDGDTYTVGVRNVNTLGKRSEWLTDTHRVIGKTAPPSVVASLSGVPSELGINLSWPAIPDADRDYYVLAFGDDRANSLMWSEEFQNAVWVKTFASIVRDVATAPDDTESADLLMEDSNTAQHFAEQIGVNVVTGRSYRAIAFFKAAGRTKARLRFSSGGFGVAPFADVDLDNGTEWARGGGVTGVSITRYNDEWCRVEITGTTIENNGNGGVIVQALAADGSETYLGDGSSGIYVWGTSLQLASENGKYKRTTLAPAVAGERTIIAPEFSGTRYTWPIQLAGAYDVNVVAVDTSGNESVVYRAVTVEVMAPSAPLNADFHITGPSYMLTWLAPLSTQFAVAEYEIRKEGAVYQRVKGTSFQHAVDWGGAKNFTIAAVDIKGNIGTEAAVAINIISPGAVSNLRPVVIDNNVLLYMTEPTIHSLPIDHYVFTRGAVFETSVEVAQSSRPFVNMFEVLGGLYTYYAVAVDTAGNRGAVSSLVVAVNQPPDFILHASEVIDPADYDTFRNAILSDTGQAFYAPLLTGRTARQHFEDNGKRTIREFIDAGYVSVLEPALV